MISRRTLQVLVVDNDEAACAATGEILDYLGCRADGKTESLAALKTFSEDPERFDFAIIELVMPEITGLDLAMRFRRIRPGFPVLFYTEYADEALPSRMEAEGFGRIVFKPLTSEELVRRIGGAFHLSVRSSILPDTR